MFLVFVCSLEQGYTEIFTLAGSYIVEKKKALIKILKTKTAA